ncbi:MAG: asparagine synthase (glutamine-hydrolyzing), partial [Rhodothermales bacterium]
MSAVVGLVDWLSVGGHLAAAERNYGDRAAQSAGLFSAWAGESSAVGSAHAQPAVALDSSLLTWWHVDEETSRVIVGDSRLDDRKNLLGRLGLSQSDGGRLGDAELLLKAYGRWGRACAKHLVGAFAFVIWDPRERILFAARDHVGLRPFYYTRTPEVFAFSTSEASLLALDSCDGSLDEPYVAGHLAYKFFSAPGRTFYKGIRTLPPGHTARVSRDGLHLERYWFPNKVAAVRYARREDYYEAFQEIFGSAMRDRLLGDDSFGVHLSGGLDSSSVAVLAARELSKADKSAPIALSWNAPPPVGCPPTDEHARIAAVCRQEDLTCHFQEISVAEVVSVLEWDLNRQPVTRVLLQEDSLQRQARRLGVRVILSGWGGDQGASYHGRDYLPSLLLGGRWAELLRAGLRSDRSAARFIHGNVWKPLRAHLAARWISPRTRVASHYVNAELLQRVPMLREPRGQVFPNVHASQAHLLGGGWLTRRLESWTVNGAINGIEYRYPLLDRRLLEFVMGIPDDLFFRNGWHRSFFREALEGVLPPEVVWNRSKGDPAR